MTLTPNAATLGPSRPAGNQFTQLPVAALISTTAFTAWVPFESVRLSH